MPKTVRHAVADRSSSEEFFGVASKTKKGAGFGRLPISVRFMLQHKSSFFRTAIAVTLAVFAGVFAAFAAVATFAVGTAAIAATLAVFAGVLTAFAAVATFAVGTAATAGTTTFFSFCRIGLGTTSGKSGGQRKEHQNGQTRHDFVIFHDILSSITDVLSQSRRQATRLSAQKQKNQSRKEHQFRNTHSKMRRGTCNARLCRRY